MTGALIFSGCLPAVNTQPEVMEGAVPDEPGRKNLPAEGKDAEAAVSTMLISSCTGTAPVTV